MSNYNDVPSEPPPSYEDAMQDPQVIENQTHSRPSKPVSSYPRPPTRISSNRPHTSNSNGSLSQQGSSRPPAPPARPNSTSLYSNNPLLPFLYPRGHYCKRCKNTGYKDSRGKPCSDCWKLLFRDKQVYNPNPELPFRYPNRFLCEKCLNTGKKWKTGRMCADCYSRFAPRNQFTSVNPTPYNTGGFGPMGILGAFGGETQIIGAPGGTRVPPGDPRLGGVLCGRCRGSGLVTFFLDQDLCPVCAGLGRILNSQMGYR